MRVPAASNVPLKSDTALVGSWFEDKMKTCQLMVMAPHPSSQTEPVSQLLEGWQTEPDLALRGSAPRSPRGAAPFGFLHTNLQGV